MKYGIVLSLLLVLTGCETAYNMTYALLSEKTEKDLTNKDGISIVDCYGKTMGKKHRAPQFWKENNLPKGTTEFVCKDYKAYLPNKATDCQGRLLTSYPNGIMGFKEQYNFPRYRLNSASPGRIVEYTAFTCQNGQVIPIKF